MRNVTIYDSTLQGCEGLSFKNRLDLARELDGVGVDCIIAASPEKGQEEALLVRTLSQMLRRSSLAVSVGLSRAEAERAAQELKNALHPLLIVSVPVSAAGMEYESGVRPDKLPEALRAQFEVCKELRLPFCFEARDASRAQPELLNALVSAAVSAGAASVILCDSEGSRLPWEFSALLRAPLAAAGKTPVIAECADRLHLGTASAVSALCAGAAGVKLSLAEDGLPALGAVAAALRERGASLELACRLNMTGLDAALERAKASMSGARRSTSPFDNGAGAPLTDLSLTADADIGMVAQAVRRLGYELEPEDLTSVYESFCRIAEKKSVDARDLDAIVSDAALQVPPVYKLKSYVIHAGNTISAIADIHLERDGKLLRGIAPGDGSVDAAFLALEQIAGCHYELDDFRISAVTEGREAMGSAFVKLRSGGRLYAGSGLSTDIIGACIHAYLAALNKIAYEDTQI